MGSTSGEEESWQGSTSSIKEEVRRQIYHLSDKILEDTKRNKDFETEIFEALNQIKKQLSQAPKPETKNTNWVKARQRVGTILMQNDSNKSDFERSNLKHDVHGSVSPVVTRDSLLQRIESLGTPSPHRDWFFLNSPTTGSQSFIVAQMFAHPDVFGKAGPALMTMLKRLIQHDPDVIVVQNCTADLHESFVAPYLCKIGYIDTTFPGVLLKGSTF